MPGFCLTDVRTMVYFGEALPCVDPSRLKGNTNENSPPSGGERENKETLMKARPRQGECGNKETLMKALPRQGEGGNAVSNMVYDH